MLWPAMTHPPRWLCPLVSASVGRMVLFGKGKSAKGGPNDKCSDEVRLCLCSAVPQQAAERLLGPVLVTCRPQAQACQIQACMRTSGYKLEKCQATPRWRSAAYSYPLTYSSSTSCTCCNPSATYTACRPRWTR